LTKLPPVERKIRRLLKVLNKPTLLFLVIRSVVAREYITENATRGILVVIFINDAGLLDKSMCKCYSAEVRRTWVEAGSRCGKLAADDKPLRTMAYEVSGERFEVGFGCDLLCYSEDYPAVADCGGGRAKLCGVKVAALRSLDGLDLVTLKQAFAAIGNGKKSSPVRLIYAIAKSCWCLWRDSKADLSKYTTARHRIRSNDIRLMYAKVDSAQQWDRKTG